MRNESTELGKARTLLAVFERNMKSADAKPKLAEALDLLARVCDSDAYEDQKRIARNVAHTYGTRVVAQARALLEADSEPPILAFRHCYELLGEFVRAGFSSQALDDTRSDLMFRMATRQIAEMTRWEKEVLVERLRADLEREST
jgi:hypothetical protein